MALGTLTVVEESAAQGPIFHDHITVVGDSAYAAGGSLLQDKFRAAVGASREILAIIPGSNGDVLLQFVKSTGKLLVRVISTGAERADGNDSAATYNLMVISK